MAQNGPNWPKMGFKIKQNGHDEIDQNEMNFEMDPKSTENHRNGSLKWM